MLNAAFSVWDGRIAPVFDTARVLVSVRFSEGVFTQEKSVTLPALSAAGVLEFMQQTASRCLICGAISRSLQDVLEANGVEVIAFVSGELTDVMRGWTEGRLGESEFRMPGCGCGKRRRGSGSGACSRQGAAAGEQVIQPNKNCRRWGGRNTAN